MTQPPLSELLEAERALAFERFDLLRPALEEGVPLARVARERGIALRTARRWAGLYRREGLAGLARQGRSDRGKRRLSDTLRQGIEGLALKKPPLSAASIHREIVALAGRFGESPPSYGTIYAVIRELGPALVTLAHEGTKSYSDAFDLIHRHEATAPNAVWQADHTELDIWLKDGRGQPAKPWLTIILDDYSRAAIGLFLIFVSQRPDKLDPLIFSECENKVVMKLGSQQVIETTRKMMGLEELSPGRLERCREFGPGRALMIGKWSSSKDGDVIYAAARRTIEGGATSMTDIGPGRSLDPRNREFRGQMPQ